jgi:hypothetical protein
MLSQTPDETHPRFRLAFDEATILFDQIVEVLGLSPLITRGTNVMGAKSVRAASWTPCTFFEQY